MPKCIICNVTSNEMPLIQFLFKDTAYHICSQHVPVLIHNSGQLANILPGMNEVVDPDPMVH
ncbi:MAG: hypothetical protein IPH57_07345 [Saprospiraceae bacterium]|nr:hypothetical protein [Saprospiraceae bacterium]